MENTVRRLLRGVSLKRPPAPGCAPGVVALSRPHRAALCACGAACRSRPEPRPCLSVASAPACEVGAVPWQSHVYGAGGPLLGWGLTTLPPPSFVLVRYNGKATCVRTLWPPHCLCSAPAEGWRHCARPSRVRSDLTLPAGGASVPPWGWRPTLSAAPYRGAACSRTWALDEFPCQRGAVSYPVVTPWTCGIAAW